MDLRYICYNFLKADETGELEIAKLLGDKFQIFRFESKKGFFWNLNDEEKAILQTEDKYSL